MLDLKERLAPESTAITPAIHTVELAKRFGKTTALAGLTMTVPPGEVFGFLGPNGAGKTTAVKLLLGLIAPTSGEGPSRMTFTVRVRAVPRCCIRDTTSCPT